MFCKGFFIDVETVQWRHDWRKFTRLLVDNRIVDIVDREDFLPDSIGCFRVEVTSASYEMSHKVLPSKKKKILQFTASVVTRKRRINPNPKPRRPVVCRTLEYHIWLTFLYDCSIEVDLSSCHSFRFESCSDWLNIRFESVSRVVRAEFEFVRSVGCLYETGALNLEKTLDQTCPFGGIFLSRHARWRDVQVHCNGFWRWRHWAHRSWPWFFTRRIRQLCRLICRSILPYLAGVFLLPTRFPAESTRWRTSKAATTHVSIVFVNVTGYPFDAMAKFEVDSPNVTYGDRYIEADYDYCTTQVQPSADGKYKVERDSFCFSWPCPRHF